jgi:phosphomannomutase
MLRAAVTSALLAAGCDVADLGVCPTPILQYSVKHLKAGGGVSISAGHNDIKWNALIFVNQEGTYLNTFQGDEVLDLYHLAEFKKAATDRLGKPTALESHLEVYFEKLAKFLESDAIRDARLKAVIDPCNGAAAKIIDIFAERLGFELIPVNNAPTGFFPHDPEPRPRNAQQVASIINAIGAPAGFLLNSDASRISLVAENGETLSEEYTFPLVADYYLRKRPGPVIANHSASRMIEDVARDHGCRVIKTRVGQSYSIQTLALEDAVLAGEGSGGLACPGFHPAFDAFLTMGLVLEIIACRRKPLSALIAELPKYHIVKEKIYCPPAKVHSVVEEARTLYPGEQLETSDGIKMEYESGWVHIRASATEPMIRIISEDRSREKAQERVEEASLFISSLLR